MVDMIGKYKVLQLLGRGGMAEAYKVQLSGPAGFERLHCIKKIRSEYADHPEFIKSFESEARIISRLLHPNIVQVFELIQDNGLCLVMEYIDGMDLDDLLKTAQKLGLQVPQDFAVYVLESLLLALDHAHTLKVGDEVVPVIHRDISPHNILLSTGGTAKLADFGIAKAAGMSEATKTGVLKGKLAYMSPEQTKGGKVPIGPQSDLFAAGVVFWEMLANERLFKATMEHQVLANVMNFEKAPIEHLSQRINDFLGNILAPNAADRFQSAKEALAALKRIGVRPCTQADAGQMVTALKGYIGSSRFQEKTKVAPKTSSSAPNTLVDNPGSESYLDEKTEVSGQSRWSSTQLENTVEPNLLSMRKQRVQIAVASGLGGFLLAVLIWVFIDRDTMTVESDDHHAVQYDTDGNATINPMKPLSLSGEVKTDSPDGNASDAAKTSNGTPLLSVPPPAAPTPRAQKASTEVETGNQTEPEKEVDTSVSEFPATQEIGNESESEIQPATLPQMPRDVPEARKPGSQKKRLNPRKSKRETEKKIKPADPTKSKGKTINFGKYEG